MKRNHKYLKLKKIRRMYKRYLELRKLYGRWGGRYQEHDGYFCKAVPSALLKSHPLRQALVEVLTLIAHDCYYPTIQDYEDIRAQYGMDGFINRIPLKVYNQIFAQHKACFQRVTREEMELSIIPNYIYTDDFKLIPELVEGLTISITKRYITRYCSNSNPELDYLTKKFDRENLWPIINKMVRGEGRHIDSWFYNERKVIKKDKDYNKLFKEELQEMLL